jgi:hypothetical protein
VVGRNCGVIADSAEYLDFSGCSVDTSGAAKGDQTFVTCDYFRRLEKDFRS